MDENTDNSWMDNSVHSIFKKLVKEKNFGEVVLVAWAYVEHIIDLIILMEFNAMNRSEDDKEFLIRGEFQEKWKLVKGYDIFTAEEKGKITRFQHQRNRMFHKALFNKLEYYTPQGREELMAAASDAFWAANEGYERKYVKGLIFKA